MSVKVAVRVRPFNAREKELDCQLCVDMQETTTVLTNPEDQKEKRFTFDFSFWSHDQFITDERGYFVAEGSKYADQQKVFDLVGKEVLDNAWEGYHCCLFAYGQTGSGKSYSMVGYGANKGIVPISMSNIFERIAANTNPDITFEVCFCMMEIYNEKIQDLLVPIKDRSKDGLKVRENQKYGVYVEGLSRHPVDTYESIEGKMEEGSKNRTIGATAMNASSSRAHTIMTIEFKKIEMINGKKTEKFAVINLVDLAGSEKISKTGAQGDRLKEGCAINQSLSTLGLVISKLADKSMGKKNIVVPYRDSALTRILQNALGGNSKTLMICAISPATDNYEETLSTLRYADQAKKIKNNAVINESEQDKMIRELRAENERLKAQLLNFPGGQAPTPGVGGAAVDEETMRKFKEMEEKLKENAFMMQEYETSFAQKLAEAKAKEQSALESEIDKTKPYLTNLNEDPLLSGKVLHSLTKDYLLIGKKNAEPTPDIILGGIGIKPQHAEITNEQGKIFLSPCDKECGDQLYVNGQKVYEKTELFHNDRLIIGTASTFIVKIPGSEEQSPNLGKVTDEQIDYEFAQSEILDTMEWEKKTKLDELAKEREAEVHAKINMIQDQYQKEKEANDAFIAKQREEYERKLIELENNMKAEGERLRLESEKENTEKAFKDQMAKYEAERLLREKERERLQKEVQQEALLKHFKEQERITLEHKLGKHISQITEANLIAKELKRDVVFSVKLVYNYVTGAELQVYGNSKASKTKIQVLVQNKETKDTYTWNLTKFTNRYFIIRDLLEQHYEGSKLPEPNTQDDPFWDPSEAHLVGQGFVCLDNLAYLIDNPTEVHLVSDNGVVGKLDVNIAPCDEDGNLIADDQDVNDDPSKLIGKRLDFAVIIKGGEILPNFCKDTYCQYMIAKPDGTFDTFKTKTVLGSMAELEYSYKKVHSIPNIDEKTLNFILNHNLKIQLYGYDHIPEKKAIDKLRKTLLKGGYLAKTKKALTVQIEEPSSEKPPEPKKEENAAFNPDDYVENQIQRDKSKTFAVNSKVMALQAFMHASHHPKGGATAATPRQGAPAGKGGKGGKDDKDCNIF